MNEKKVFEEITEFASRVRNIMDKSDKITKQAMDSMNDIEAVISAQEVKIKDLVKTVNTKTIRRDHLNVSVTELEKILDLFDKIEFDRLEINEGPKGTLEEYISKLEFLKKMDKYMWIKDITFEKKRNKRFEIDLQTYLKRYSILMTNGENMICNEFQNIIKHYSNQEQLENYISFVFNSFNEDIEKNEAQDSGEDKPENEKTEQETTLSLENIELFIPNETIKKLELVCWWFIQREQNYEIFDENNQHCDIETKLKFSEIRNQFLHLCLKTYFKMSSLGLVKDSNGKFKANFSKLFNQVRHISSQTPANPQPENPNIQKPLNQNQNNQNDVKTPTSPLNQTNTVFSKSKKPSDLIEAFAENLDFSLRLLKNENYLIQKMFIRSEETRIDLISKLTIFVLEQIQKECELFFTDSLDFSKLTNINDNVIYAIIRLIVKFKNLKEKAECLQNGDLSSASKIIQFSLSLNQTSSQIFSTFLEVIGTGHFNTSEIPTNSSVHDYTIKICQAWVYIYRHENDVLDSIRSVVDGVFVSKHNKKKAIKTETEEDEEISQRYQRTRRGNTIIDQTDNEEENEENNQNVDNFDEFKYSDRWYVCKYYSSIVEKLDNFLIDETTKFCSSNKTLNFSSFSKNFIQHLKSLKGFIFLINNQTYVMDFIKKNNLLNDFKILNPNFESTLKANTETNITTAIEIFKYVHTKWFKLEIVVPIKPKSKDSNESEMHDYDNVTLKKADSILSINSIKTSSKFKSSADLSSKNSSFNVFKTSKKKKEEALLYIKETISTCLSLVVEDEITNIMLRNRVNDYFYPVLHSCELLGDLKKITENFLLKNNDPHQDNTLADLVMDNIFPTHSSSYKL